MRRRNASIDDVSVPPLRVIVSLCSVLESPLFNSTISDVFGPVSGGSVVVVGGAVVVVVGGVVVVVGGCVVVVGGSVVVVVDVSLGVVVVVDVSLGGVV